MRHLSHLPRFSTWMDGDRYPHSGHSAPLSSMKSSKSTSSSLTIQSPPSSLRVTFVEAASSKVSGVSVLTRSASSSANSISASTIGFSSLIFSHEPLDVRLVHTGDFLNEADVVDAVNLGVVTAFEVLQLLDGEVARGVDCGSQCRAV